MFNFRKNRKDKSQSVKKTVLDTLPAVGSWINNNNIATPDDEHPLCFEVVKSPSRTFPDMDEYVLIGVRNNKGVEFDIAWDGSNWSICEDSSYHQDVAEVEAQDHQDDEEYAKNPPPKGTWIRHYKHTTSQSCLKVVNIASVSEDGYVRLSCESPEGNESIVLWSTEWHVCSMCNNPNSNGQHKEVLDQDDEVPEDDLTLVEAQQEQTPSSEGIKKFDFKVGDIIKNPVWHSVKITAIGEETFLGKPVGKVSHPGADQERSFYKDDKWAKAYIIPPGYYPLVEFYNKLVPNDPDKICPVYEYQDNVWSDLEENRVHLHVKEDGTMELIEELIEE